MGFKDLAKAFGKELLKTATTPASKPGSAAQGTAKKTPLVDPAKPADHPVNQPKPAAAKPTEEPKPKAAAEKPKLPRKQNGKVVFLPPAHDSLVGEIVLFGNYPNCGGKVAEPIRWVVLENNGGELLLVSAYPLGENIQYHAPALTDWASSDIRKFLNGDFYNAAFNDTEKSAIMINHLSDNGEWDYNNTPETDDRVFLFNIGEYMKHRATYINRYCKPIEMPAWWLRNKGTKGRGSAAYVSTGSSGACIAKQHPNPEGNGVHAKQALIPLIRVKGE